MKLYLILLFVTTCLSQDPIVIQDGMKEGTPLKSGEKLLEINCLENVTFQTTIKSVSNLFQFNRTSKQVVLARDVNMTADVNIPKNFENNSCLFMVNNSNNILTVFCGNHQIQQSYRILLEEMQANPKLCFKKNCSEIQSPLELLIYEDTTKGETLLNFTLCDKQAHTSSNPFNKFPLTVSGYIIEEHSKKSFCLNRTVDYESNQTSFTSKVTVNGTTVLNINIEIGDSDDQGIEFENTVYNCDILEGEKAGVTECTVKANDLDTGINQTIEYKLLSVIPSDTRNLFQVLENGSLNLSGSLDREEVSGYYINVKGYQTNNESCANFTIIKVNVGDIDDNKPEMLQENYNVSLMENSPIGTLLCTVSATDKDTGLNAEYSFEMDASNIFFDVNNTTGRVTVKAVIDRETEQSLEFKVYAKALNKTNWQSNYTSIKVIVLDENDNTPELKSPSFSVEINKTKNKGSNVLQMDVSDPDEGVNGDFNCSMQPTSDYFEIYSKNRSCAIVLTSTLNETQQLQFIFDVTVQDLAHDPDKRRSSSERVTINITDVNIHAPVFGEFPRSLNIPESTENGTLLVILTASDEDPTDALTFNITQGDTFKLDDKNRIYLKDCLDREQKSSYNILVTVFDGVHSLNTSIYVTVLDVNDNSPIFINSAYTFNISEESNPSYIGNIKALDADVNENGNVEYFIEENSEWKKNISVDQMSGNISTITSIDREEMHGEDYISFFVFAKDKGTPVLTNHTRLKIYVKDLNDNAPVFHETKVNITVVEETPVEDLTYIYKVQASDIDGSNENREIFYYLEDDGDGLVSLESTTGVLSMLKLPYINDNCTNKTFIVKVSANNSAPFENATKQIITITVYIEDINNHKPTFSFEDVKSLQLSLKQPMTLINIKNADDSDCKDVHKNISFHLAYGSDPRLQLVQFVNKSVGVEYRSNKTDPSHFPECARSLAVEVYATDGLFKTFHNTSLKLQPNFYDPIPVNGNYTIRVKENKTNTTGYMVGFLDCPDISLKISINETEKFSINQTGHNGTIIVKQPLDYEKETKIVAKVSAQNIDDTSKTSSSLVTIIIEDENDESPVFSNKSYTFSLKETDDIGTIIGYVYATDKDTNSYLTYNCKHDCKNSYFSVSKDGILTLTKQIDLDRNISLCLINGIVTVSDGIHDSDVEVKIIVEFINEYSPKFGKTTYNFNVTEDTNSTHFNITATDNDRGEGGKIAKYSLRVPENWLWNSNVSVTSDGNVRVNTIDRDTMGDDNKIAFAVEATDSGNPARRGIAYVTITIEDRNDNKPEFPDNEKNVSIHLKENVKPYTYKNIFRSKAYDADIGKGSEVFYRCVNSSMFEINKTTGVLSSNTSLTIDDTNKGHITVTIEAYNKNSSLKSSQIVNIFLEDINNNNPQFTKVQMSKNVSECTPIGSNITRIYATDADTTEEYNTVTFWTDDYSDKIHIDSRTGIVYLIGEIDVDMPKNDSEFHMIVYATDDLKNRDTHSNHTVNTTLTLIFEDCNDHVPVFTKDKYICFVKENSTTPLNCSVKAEDGDRTHKPIKYSLLSGNEQKHIDITSTTGELFIVSPFDYENIRNKTMVLNISVSDGELNSTSLVEIHVVDVNDVKPQFLETPYNFTIEENEYGTFAVVGRVYVEDKDSPYDLQFENCTDIVNVLERRDVVLKKALDYENMTSITCLLSANDTTSKKDVVTEPVVIHVLDKNDNAPLFTANCCSTLHVNKTAGINVSVITMNVSDPDKGANGEFNCSMLPTSDYFEIRSKSHSCVIVLTSTLSETQQLQFIFDVTVQDLAHDLDQRRSSSVRVTINITDVNIHTPVFGEFPRSLNISESTEKGTLLAILTACDNDPADTLMFNITHEDTFKLDDENRIYLKEGLDREKKSSYNILVTVFDGVHTQSTSIYVTVLDVNDNSPIFKNSTYTFYINEESNLSYIGNVHATDGDENENGEVEYFIEKTSEWKKNISVDKSGRLSTITPIDREEMHGEDHISFFVFAKDKGTPVLTNHTYVKINVKDLNDNAPVFHETKVNITVVEETPVEDLTHIYKVQTSDKDGSKKNREIIYNLEDDGGGLVSLDSTTGVLSMLKLPYINDSCTNQSFSVNISANNPAPFDEKVIKQILTITINIEDINNHKPTFSFEDSKSLQLSLKQPIDLINYNKVYDVDCKDVHKNISFHLAYGSDPRLELVQFGNKYMRVGYRSNKTDPSRFPECARSLAVEVYATDGLFKTFKNTSLNLQPNFYKPIPVKSNYTIRVKENATYTTQYMVGFLDCPDISLKIFINDTSFNISQSGHNGTIVVDKPLDYEKETQIFAEVSAKNVEDESKSSSSLVTIIIEDENDESPKFSNKSYTFSLKETDEIGTIIGYVYATDKDTNSKLTYSCRHSDCKTYFNISNHGIITLTQSIDLDLNDSRKSINGTISVSDEKHYSIAVVNLNVEFINEFSPVFGEKNYNCTVVDDTSGKNLSITATDKDKGEDGKIANYSLLVPKNWIWKSNVSVTSDGQVTVNKIDRDIMGEGNKIVFAVEATDSGSPPRKGKAYVTITVEGLDDNPPKYPDNQKNVSIYLKENENPSENIFQSKANDADIGVGSEVFYRVVNRSMFKINKTTGDLSSTTGLLINDTNKGHIIVMIQAYSDDEDPPHQNNIQIVNIFLEDINNNKPHFSCVQMLKKVPECTPVGSNITRIYATDADTTEEYSTVTFWTDDYIDKIHIDSRTGIVYLIGEIDVDMPKNESEFHIIVYATDDLKNRDTHSNHTVNTTLTLFFEDCNDHVPAFTKDKYICFVKENSTTSLNCNVKAEDGDRTHEPIIYSLLNGNVQKHIDINSTTGELFIVSPFDYENKDNKTVMLNISASDGELNSTSLVEIHVVDVNDVRPVFLETPYNFKIEENEYGKFAVVGRIYVEDKDSPYDIQFENCTDIVNVLEKRDVVLKKALDYENMTSITCLLSANDTTSKKDVVTEPVVIHVLDKNDNAPLFAANFCNTLHVNKTAGINMSVITMNISDPDKGVNGEFNCSMQPTSDYFEIRSESHSCVIVLTSTLSETQQLQFIFDVTVQDLAHDLDKRRSSSVRVTINITDVNIHAPEFDEFPLSLNISESTEKGALLVILTASDKDPADTLTFNITHEDTFKLDDENRIYLKEGLDREQKSSYNILVTVFDGVHRQNTSIYVTVTDVNDNSPIFINSAYTFNKSEESNQSYIGNVHATDADENENGVVVYFIEETSKWKKNISVDQKSGSISTSTPIDREEMHGEDYISFFVFAKDKGTPVLTNHTYVKINVKDLNDNAPVFHETKVNITVVEETPVEDLTHIYKVQASDKDESNKNREIIYNLEDDCGGLVSLDSTTGFLSMLKLPYINDSCTNKTFSVQVSANNSAPFYKYVTKQILTITINIEDINNHKPTFSFEDVKSLQLSLKQSMTLINYSTAHDVDCKDVNKNISFRLAYGSDPRLKLVQFQNKSVGVEYRSNQTDPSRFPECARSLAVEVYATDGLFKTFENTSLKLQPNLYKPIPVKSSYTIRVKENATYTTQYMVGFLDCPDISLKIIINDTRFNISQTGHNGTIVVDKPLDYEKETKIFAEVSAKNVKDESKSSSSLVTIIIEDENDESPKFSNKSYTFSLKETDKIGTIIGYVYATDKDTNSKLTYSCRHDSGCNRYFNISNHGIITLTQSIDLDLNDSRKSINGTISVSDDKHNSAAVVNINVEYINEFSPVFGEKNYNCTVVDDTSGKNLSITATDKDKGEDGKIANYSLLVPKNWIWKSNVSVTSDGQVIVNKINRDIMDEGNKIVFAVEAIDSGRPPRKGKAYVTITVEGIDDNPPEYPDNQKNVSIYLKENEKSSENIFQSKANDADIGVGSEVFYRVVNRSMFKINKTTGDLSSTTGLIINDTNKGHIIVMIEAYNDDEDPPHQNNKQIINIFLEDINNNKPHFTDLKMLEKVPECTPVGSNITRIYATDADTTEEYNTVTFWTDDYSDKIHIDSRTGIVFLIGEIDVDMPKNESLFHITVYATDDLKNRDTNSNHTVNTTLTLIFQDCNDHVPAFTKDKYICFVNENSTTLLNCSVKAEDGDRTHEPIIYSLLNGNEQKHVDINSTTGDLLVVSPFDYESIKNKTLVLNISASDGELNSTSLIEIHVVDVNDVRPVFLKTPYNFEIEENEYSKFAVVGRVNVEDKDSPYDIQFENCTDIVKVLERRDVVLKKALDYENMTSITCLLSANDTTSEEDVVTEPVVIHVLDKNDNAPLFAANCCSTLHVNETAGINMSVITATATDADKGNNSVVTYDIFSGNTKQLFKINSSSGEIRTNRNLTGYGGIDISLVVKATDHGKPSLSGYKNILIQIDKLNVNAPKFVNVPYSTSIFEGNEEKAIFQVYAQDKDHDPLNYTVVTFTDKFVFKNSTLYAHDIDAETMNKTVFVKVKVSDGEWSDTSTVEITVIDVNDNSPHVDAASCNVTIEDTTNIGDVICTATATDKDVDNSGFTYILYGDKGDFLINRTSGEITLRNKLGHNGQNYNMSIVVSDSGSRPKYIKTFLSIHVNDTNPQFGFNSPRVFNVSENDKNANVSFKIDSSDKNIYNLTYQIISRNRYLIMKTFKLNNFTGFLTLANKSNSLNFEIQNTYNFTIFAKDNGVFPKSASAHVIINVLDINERPEMTLTSKTVFLDENSAQGTFVSRVTVRDPDTNDRFLNFTFSLSDNENFKIDKNGSITIATKNILGQVYVLNVTVSDGGNLSDSKSITIKVPYINRTQCYLKMPENNNASEQICNFATKVNGEYIYYEIDAAPVSGNFKVINGSLLLDTANAFDREETEFVSFYVTGYYTKYGTKVANISVILQIEDINDCSPYFVNSKHIVTIDDVTENDSIIEHMAAIDRDVEEKNRNLTYTIETSSDIFSIDNFGNLKLSNSSNLKISTPYLLNITVSDGIHLNKNNATVEIIVADTNNFSPMFDNRTYKFQVTETNETNVVIGSLTANDMDRGRNGNITFSIITINSDDIFNLSNQTNNSCIIATTNPIDRETLDTYFLIITATDHGTFPRKSACRVTIDVLDVNDNSPVFKGVSPIYGSISENSPNGTRAKFPQIIFTDKDYGINGSDGLVYMFNDTMVPFCIGNNRNKQPFVYLCAVIDREEQDVYYLELIAYDANGSNDSRKTGIPLVIRILDVNDEVPKFSQNRYTFNALENQKQSINIGNVSVTDKDNGKNFLYYIISGDDGKFVIDSMNGMIYAVGNIDREIQTNFTMNISVSDGKNKAYTTVEVNVDDINDNSPKFGHFLNDSLKEMLVVEVSENINSGLILNLTANDKDDEDNGHVNYILDVLTKGCESDLFSISPYGGLLLKKPLDREKCDYYEMNITASDLGKPKLSTSIIVNVKVLDMNDNEPVFCDSSSCNITTAKCRTVEKAPVSSVLKVLMVYDPDEGQNANFSFKFEQSSISSYFKIDTIGTNIGLVSIGKPLAKNKLIHGGVSETGDKVEINVTIVATDGGGLNSTLILKISVEPLNDNVPVFDRSFYNFNVSENVKTGVSVGLCEATTNDTIKKLTYEIISTYIDTSAPFEIITNTGEIRTATVMDREKVEKYVFAVQVRDGRTPERTAFTAVKITINDVNDNAPVFKKDNITIHVTENRTVYTDKNVSASDKDKGDNALISYQLNHNYSELFHIDDKGMLTINGTFDYEDKISYTINITATDKGSPPLNTISQINVLVEDVNDNAPVFKQMKDFYNVLESRRPFEIFNVTASDKDSDLNGKVIYKLQNMDDVPFAINPFNGSVYLQCLLDYEAKSKYTLNIVAQDLGSPPYSSMSNVTIYVMDVYDDIITFGKDLYEIDITTSTSLNFSILNLTVNVPNASFSLKGDDSEYFHIGNKTGKIVLAKSVSSERQLYVFQVNAYDFNGRNASCTVIANVLGHDVTFDKSEINLSLMENVNISTVLVDLDTKAEFTDEGATYTICDVQPTGMDLFSLNNRTGVLKCIKPLDRETQAQYIIIVSAHTSVMRRKRDTSKSDSTIRVVVDVGDVNDNPPQFPDEQERVFGVPDNVRANYIVGVIKAIDNDTSDIDRLRYNVTGGRTDVFGISRDKGEIKTLVAIASTRVKIFNLSVSVSDGVRAHKKATLNVTIYVVPTKNQPILTVDMRVDDVNAMREGYRRNMSELLGIQIQFEKIESHHEVDKSTGMTRVDLSRTDLIFHGVNNTSGLLVSNEEMERLIKIHNAELSNLFGMKRISSSRVIIDVIADPSAISATQILLICMAVFIFFGSFAALIVAQYSWSRYETERQEAEKKTERLENEFELSTIRSRQSSKLSSITAAAAVNPAFIETEFTVSHPTQTEEQSPQSETQEMPMIFEDEPLEAVLKAQGLVNASPSVIDSGVGNTSVHSNGNILDNSNHNARSKPEVQLLDIVQNNGEGPVMTSSPRISRETKPTKDHIITTKNPKSKVDEKKDTRCQEIEEEPVIQETRSRRASFLLLDATGESETDDTVDDTGDRRKVILKSAAEDNVKAKKVVIIQLPSESTPRDQHFKIFLKGDMRGAERDEADGAQALQGENGDDSDFDCTSF